MMSTVSTLKTDIATIHLDSCLGVLRSMPDASIDSIVTDPPYGLSNTDPAHVVEALTKWATGERDFVPTGRGFMGKSWDAFVPPPAVWDECFRVLKPGGHLLAFAGSRTFDLMTLSIRFAGFDIRDGIAWLYGCHDDQTEVLTRRGWVNGLDLTDEDEVAQWATDGTVSLVKPTARQRYSFDGRMVRFRNADVDQLVTPNHRVYLQTSERVQVGGKRTATWSDWHVEQAADVNRWQRMRLPAAGFHDGPGIGGTDYAALLGWMWAEGGFDLTGTGVRVYQSSVNQPFVDEIAALLDRLGPHKRYDYERTYTRRNGEVHPHAATTWFISGDLANRVRTDLPGKTPTWDLLWRMTADEKRALWDAAMKGDGSKGQRTFWQKDRAALEWAQALLAGIGCRGKVADDPRGALHWTERSTVELQARHLVDAGEDYTGEVWCVTVPSGAFVVRRNGRVSISGNSGFPKSLDVSKAIDKAAGATREVVGSKLDRPGYHLSAHDGGEAFGHGLSSSTYETRLASSQITAPATPAAQEWQGWGTALKPAFEPIVVARKPLIGTVAANVLAHGTGALNIDGARVGTDVVGWSGNGRSGDSVTAGASRGGTPGGYNYADAEPRPVSGRWPTNVVMDGDTADALDEQTGVLTSGKMPAGTQKRGKEVGIYGKFEPQPSLNDTIGDSGGASRFFPTFRYQAKAPTRERPVHVAEDGTKTAHPTVKPLALMRWLVKLVTPPGGTVLDPFVGSGTTVEAAALEGFQSVGIEGESNYLPLIQQRLDRVAEGGV